MIIVHVIPPPGTSGHRHEEHFPDEMSDHEILIRVEERSARYGFLITGTRPNGSPSFVSYFDHPGTIIAVGDVVKKEFVEVRRIKGPGTPEAAAETPPVKA